MTKRAFRPTGVALSRSGMITGAVVLIAAFAAGCSAVKPAATGATGADAASSGSTGADSFGVPAVAGEVKDGGKLVMALSAEPDKLDPTLSRSLYSRYVFNSMCQKLYDLSLIHISEPTRQAE